MGVGTYYLPNQDMLGCLRSRTDLPATTIPRPVWVIPGNVVLVRQRTVRLQVPQRHAPASLRSSGSATHSRDGACNRTWTQSLGPDLIIQCEIRGWSYTRQAIVESRKNRRIYFGHVLPYSPGKAERHLALTKLVIFIQCARRITSPDGRYRRPPSPMSNYDS